MEQRLLVISPVHNEASHIELIAHALAAQTRRPDLWIVVDDSPRTKPRRSSPSWLTDWTSCL